VEEGQWTTIEEMGMFKRVERLVDDIWSIVSAWKPLAQDTIG
jgi:hypothetical protein